MKAFLTGCITSVLILINTVIGIIPMMVIALIKLLIPIKPFQRQCALAVTWIAETWAEINKAIFGLTTRVEWDIRGDFTADRQHSYLIVCNHQSWVDIPALIQVFNKRIPFYRFFLKQQLIFVPLLGLAFWALEFPFMKRYSKAELEKKPHLKGKDLAATRRACERYRTMPVSIINYPEGTRMTPAKRAAQQSPYQHLLKPKAGGAAFVLESMAGQIHSVLDVTIAYPGGTPTFLDLLCGRVRQVIVEVNQIPVSPEWRDGGYETNEAYRLRFQQWISELWAEKDQRLNELNRRRDERRNSTDSSPGLV